MANRAAPRSAILWPKRGAALFILPHAFRMRALLVIGARYCDDSLSEVIINGSGVRLNDIEQPMRVVGDLWGNRRVPAQDIEV